MRPEDRAKADTDNRNFQEPREENKHPQSYGTRQKKCVICLEELIVLCMLFQEGLCRGTTFWSLEEICAWDIGAMFQWAEVVNEYVSHAGDSPLLVVPHLDPKSALI